MRIAATALLTVLLALTAGPTLASGQRSATITTDAIARYPVIDVQAGGLPETGLHYVGSTSRWHLLMITRTAVARDAQGRPLRPWDTVFAYKVAADGVTIDNGWLLDLSQRQGILVSPRNCPYLRLRSGQLGYTLPADARLEAKCLGQRSTAGPSH